jgi:hypothetical protein
MNKKLQAKPVHWRRMWIKLWPDFPVGLSVATLCLAGIVLTGCAGPSQVQPETEGVTDHAVLGFDTVNGPNVVQIVWRDGYQFVRIEASEGAPSAQLEAGPSLGVEGVKRALNAVRLRKGSGDPTQAFDAAEINALAEPLAKALAALKPGQEVAFSVRYSLGVLALGQKTITAGRIFPDNGSLDIIFGTVRAPYAGQLIATGMPPTIQTGSRRRPTQVDYSVVSEGSVSLARSDRGDWAKIAQEAWNTPQIAPAAAVNAPNSTVTPAAVAPPSRLSPAPEPDAKNLRDPKDIEQRIETLRRLLDKHLITEEEFERHKNDLLNRL